MTDAALVNLEDGSSTTFSAASSWICIRVTSRFYEVVDSTITTGTGISLSRCVETQKNNLVVGSTAFTTAVEFNFFERGPALFADLPRQISCAIVARWAELLILRRSCFSYLHGNDVTYYRT